ncbi:MAG: 50S ribosomal protein L18 [Verrucomicrobia bacterium]|nr:50S ribosomal protein L18 [Verrucomicrobiota bacterium]
MINELIKRNVRRRRRMLRVRKHVRGTAEKPRLTVFKSNMHIFAQLIDDEKGFTIASAGTVQKDFRDQKLGKRSKDAARKVGTMIAEVAKQKNIVNVVFDRGFNKYHGLLAEVANAARETGLQF